MNAQDKTTKFEAGKVYQARSIGSYDDYKKYNIQVSYTDGYSFLVKDCGHVISGSREIVEALSKTCEWAGGTITIVEVSQKGV